jgi:hypothetical protein
VIFSLQFFSLVAFECTCRMHMLFTARTSELFLYMVLLNVSPRPSEKNARVFQLVDSTRSDCAIIIIYFSQMHSIEENGKNCVSHDHMKNFLSAVESACFWRIILAGLSTIQGQFSPKHPTIPKESAYIWKNLIGRHHDFFFEDNY